MVSTENRYENEDPEDRHAIFIPLTPDLEPNDIVLTKETDYFACCLNCFSIFFHKKPSTIVPLQETAAIHL